MTDPSLPDKGSPPEPPPIVRGYLQAAEWTTAKTMPDNPHEYLVLPKDPGPEREAWRALARWVLAGTDRKWHGRKYRTNSWGGFDMWVMDARPILVNRKPTGRAGWDDERPVTDPNDSADQAIAPDGDSHESLDPVDQPKLWLHESDCWGWDPDGGEPAK
jgi:hypothetical protein